MRNELNLGESCSVPSWPTSGADALIAEIELLQSIGALGASLAHDINNALTVVRASLEILRVQIESGQLPDMKSLDRAMHVTDRSAEMTRRLLAAAHREEECADWIELRHAVEQSMDLLELGLEGRHHLVTDLARGPLWVQASQSRIEQMLLNLVINARDAMPGGGTVTVRLMLEHPERFALLSVEDEGTGIPPRILAHIFEPFFTTKPCGKGTGLGLPSVRYLAESVGACIRVDSGEGRGTQVRLRFPLMP